MMLNSLCRPAGRVPTALAAGLGVLLASGAGAQTEPPGGGPKLERLYARLLEHETPRVIDLLFHLPSGAIDRRARPKLNEVQPGQVVTRTQLIERVWEYHFDPGTNLVDVYIQRLRRKIDDGEDVKLIQTVRGVGYCVRAE